MKLSPTLHMGVCGWLSLFSLSLPQNFVDRTYLDQATALALNITYASHDTFVIQADDTTVLAPTDPGRNSARIRSVKTYTTHVEVSVLFLLIFHLAYLFKGL